MRMILTTLPVLMSLLAAPAQAGGQDPHAGHHPAETAPAASTAPPKPVEAPARDCPMMTSGMMSGGGMGGAGTHAPGPTRSAPPASTPMGKPSAGSMPDGAMMKPGDMPCMPPAAQPAARETHDHPTPKPGG
ncbi:hypothetical protein PMI01_02323 [Caulobacter sp. AP07]|uniref:hypothetical protein n=1 Tax=Caulobacter sp. AP07 TaxID=1144304 RepID=UPI000271DED4|nr:hypothetical protein [Caulobacter sp. AP07]EJL32994.1 hypothetical protein PMI01_02323 [Caulobacter sp. AP07]